MSSTTTPDLTPPTPEYLSAIADRLEATDSGLEALVHQINHLVLRPSDAIGAKLTVTTMGDYVRDTASEGVTIGIVLGQYQRELVECANLLAATYAPEGSMSALAIRMLLEKCHRMMSRHQRLIDRATWAHPQPATETPKPAN